MIPGVTVVMWPGARTLSFKMSPGRFLSDYTVIAVAGSGRLQISNTFFQPEYTETVIAMIRDQAAWLAEQNGGAE